ncbi:hypothetical protein KKF38_00275 [Patescibacteria group bacterium]|nr:hypothetical protein [Patescibacteria group bacterium]
MKKEIPQNPDVIGAGGVFNYALIKTLAKNNSDLMHLLILNHPEEVAEARKDRVVERFFGEKISKTKNPEATRGQIKLPENVEIFSFAEFLENFRGKIQKLFLPVYPSYALREYLKKIAAAVPPKAFKDCEIISASKGMEAKNFQMGHEIIEEVLIIRRKVLVMLGGNLAFDLACGMPMITEMAGKRKRVLHAAALFKNSPLRVYPSFERRILDIAGPIKNTHSLAAGIASASCENPESTIAAIIARGLAEYERIAFVAQHSDSKRQQKASAKAKKLYEQGKDFRVAPIGKGVTSDYSLFRATRNFSAGVKLAELLNAGLSAKKASEQILAKKTVESLFSTIPLRNYTKQLGVEAPFIEITAAILEGKINLQQAAAMLKSRKTRNGN